METGKKLLRIALAVILCMGLLPISASAAQQIVEMDGTLYASLADAVAAVPADGTQKTITLLKATSGSGVKVQANQNIVFDFGGYTYTVTDPLVGSTGTETNGFQLLKGATVTMKNGTILVGSSAKILVQNYCDLTLKDITLDTSDSKTCNYILSNNHGNVSITGSTSIYAASGKAAFDLYYWPKNGYADGVTVTVDTTGTISGIIEYGSDGSDTGKTGIAEKAQLTIKNGDMDVTFSTYSLGSDGQTGITITGGIFSSDPSDYLADGASYASLVHEGASVYAVGDSVAKISSNVSSGDTLSLLSGSLTLQNVPSGVQLLASPGVSLSVTYTLTATSGEGGTVSPSGSTTVNKGESKTFTVSAEDGYAVSDVKVDGVSVGTVTTYTFTDISARHTIEAVFEKTASAGTAGTTGTTSATSASEETVSFPQTGDTSGLELWLGLLVLATAGLAGSLVGGKKHRYN